MKVKQDKIKSRDVQTQNKTCVIKDMFASLFLSFVGENRKMTKLFFFSYSVCKCSECFFFFLFVRYFFFLFCFLLSLFFLLRRSSDFLNLKLFFFQFSSKHLFFTKSILKNMNGRNKNRAICIKKNNNREILLFLTIDL